MINPALTQMMQMQQQPQQPPQQQNPLSSGALAGMQAAREAVTANQTQKSNAFGMALMKMGQQMGNPTADYGDGFAGTLGRINAAIMPGAETYQNSVNHDEETNKYLMQAAINNQMQQQNADLQREKFDYDKTYNDRYLKMQENKMKAKYGGSKIITPEGLDLSQYTPISGVAAKNSLVKEKRNTGAILHEINDIEKDLAKFEKLTQKNIFSPVNPYTSKATNKVKDWTATTFRNKDALKERDLRNTLESKLLVFRTEAERRLKGGVLSQGLAKRFEDKNALPSLNEDFSITKAKLNDLRKKAMSANESAKLSLKYGVHIDSDEVEALENNRGGIEEAAPANVGAQSAAPDAQESTGNPAELVNGLKGKFPGFANYSDEQILEWAKSRGLL